MLEIQSLEDQLVKKDSSFDSFPADGALRHPVSAHLASPVAAQEDHVLQAVKAHWTHRLEKKVKLLCSVVAAGIDWVYII